MKNVGMLLATMLVGAFSLMFGAAKATAQPGPRMLVLIDASGSMSIQRSDGSTRFAGAKAAATAEVLLQAQANATLRVAIRSFSGATYSRQTSGFVDANTALDVIDGLDLFTIGGGSTPLALGMCDAVDELVESGGTTKLLHVSSDGEENSTPTIHHCAGPSAQQTPYEDFSWQAKVRTWALGKVSVSVALFSFNPNLAGSKRVVHDPEASITAGANSQGGPQTTAAPTLAQFFSELAAVTGGQLNVVDDTAPLPVSGDLNGDRCVDRNDALSVARAFGSISSPSENVFDVNRDGIIGFSDYNVIASLIGNGCLAPPADPYVASGPLVCPANGGTLTIDGKAVTGSSFAVTGGHNCRIVIKNSLIVGDLAGISMAGNNRVTVDNSIVVGNGVIGVSGFTKLSAAKTIFHGAKLEPDGALEYVDRGGNVWEE
jgi:hypothetical protein